MSHSSLTASPLRRLLSVLALATVTVASSIAAAAPASADANFTYTLVNNSTAAQITGCVSTCPTDLVIPPYVDNYPVERIGPSAFSSRGLTSVSLPSGLQRILPLAFSSNSLTKISIPSSVSLIGGSAFVGNRLTFVSLPANGSLTTIGSNAFANNNLTEIYIPGSVMLVDSAAFRGNGSLSFVLFRGNGPAAGIDFVFSNTSVSTVYALTGSSGWGYTWSGLPVSFLSEAPPASATPTPTPTYSAPGTPTINSVTAGNGRLTINFTAPASNGGSVITNYQFSLNAGATWNSSVPATTSSPLIVTGLTNGTTYSVKLGAINSVGPGSSTAAVSATPTATTPGTPTINSVTAGDSQFSVNFTAPTSDGGASLTNYEYSLDGGTNWIASDATTSPIVVSGLTNGTAYSVKLRAVNSVGSGSANAAVSVIPTLSADGYTFRLDGEGNATVTGCVGPCPAALVIPSSLDGHPVTSTGDQAFAGKGLTSLTIPTSVIRMGWAGFISNSLTSVTFLGNAPFDPTVVFDGNGSLSAVDVQFGTTGWGATFSDVPVHVVPIAPGAPTVYSFTGGNGQATVTFTEPASTGGSAITNYLVEYKPTSDSSWTTFSHDASASTLSYTISGLTNGTSYDVRVSAVNTVGTSSASAASSATLATTPDSPTVDSVDAGNGHLTINFSLIAFYDGGSPVTSYQYSLDDGFNWVAADTTSSPIVVTGLINGTTYSVKLRAVNSVGAGSANAAVSATPVTTPGAPTVDSVTGGNGQTTVEFSAPAIDGGSLITDYVVEFKLSSAISWHRWMHPVSATTLSYTITGLTNGAAHNVRVSAVNAVGTGTASTTSSVTPVTGKPAGAPTILSNVIGNGRVTLGISAPKNTGGTSITGYEYTIDGGATWLPVDSSSTSTSLLIAGLQNGTTYVVKVRARNGAGGGAASKTRTVTPSTVAGAPTITGLVARSGNITVSFAAPESNGGSAITRYGYSVNGGAFVMFIPSGYSKVIKALKNGVVYSVRIKALNAAGWSEASNAVEATPNK